MKLTALELPEDIRQWPVWLEEQVVGPDLRRLVRQLEAINSITHGDSAIALEPQLRELMAGELPGVLENGMKSLSESRLLALVQQPRLLLPLQELVFTEGGEYWQTVPRSASLAQANASIAQRVAATVSTSQEPTTLEKVELQSNQTASSILNSRRLWLTVTALAAAILLMFIWRPSVGTQRYFARAGLMDSQETGQAFTLKLASSIRSDWQRSQQAGQFESELRALRDSCDVLLKAPLSQLPSQIAADLKQRCEKWRTTFSECLEDLKAGQPLEQVRAKADATVDRLVQVLESLG